MRKQKGGWDVVFTDGSSKIAYQWLTDGYGVWYGAGDERNRSFVLARDEDQTNNKGGAKRSALCPVETAGREATPHGR